jgi:general secretion pathway protein L
MKLFISLDAPHKWVILSSKGQVKDSGVVTELENYRIPKSVEQVIGVARGETIACHSVRIPGKRRRHIESALPYALEDRLTEDVEDIHFKLLSWQVDDLAYAAVVSRKQVLHWINGFRNFGVYLDAIIPDYLLLPQQPKGGITIAKTARETYSIRTGRYQGLSLDNEGFGYWWQTQTTASGPIFVNDIDLARRLIQSGDEPVSDNKISGDGKISHWGIGDDFTQWLANGDFLDNIDSLSILDGTFLPTHNKKGANLVKLAVVISVVGLGMYVGFHAFEYKQLESQKKETGLEIRSLFARHFPDEPYLDRPRDQLISLINNARTGKVKNTEFQFYMNAVSRIIPGLNAVIEEINFRENEMIVLCTVQDLSSLDTIMQAFNEYGTINAVLMSSGARDGKITGRFRLNKRV